MKDLPRRTASDKVLSDKAFEIASNPEYDGYGKKVWQTGTGIFENQEWRIGQVIT